MKICRMKSDEILRFSSMLLLALVAIIHSPVSDDLKDGSSSYKMQNIVKCCNHLFDTQCIMRVVILDSMLSHIMTKIYDIFGKYVQNMLFKCMNTDGDVKVHISRGIGNNISKHLI